MSSFGLPRCFGFWCEPYEASSAQTVVAGDVLSTPPRLRPADTAALKGRANSLTAISRLGSETNTSQASRKSTAPHTHTHTHTPPPPPPPHVFEGVGRCSRSHSILVLVLILTR